MSDAQPDTHSTPNPQPGAQAQQTFFDGAGFPENTTASRTATRAGAADAAKASPAPRAFSLKISATQNGAPLGKAQRAFNRLVAQIENLRAAIAKKRRLLDNALQYHAQKLHPIDRQISERRKVIAIFAHTHLKTAHSAFSKKQRRTLRAFISMQLHMVIATEGGLADEKLQAMFADVEGMTLGEARRQDRDAEREQIEEEMADLGVDIDLSAFREDMTPEEYARAAADVMEQFKKSGLDGHNVPPQFRHLFPSGNTGAGAPAKPRKKTKRQLEREAREKAIEEARTRSLSTIYKQLARAFHPDLEQNPALKKQKETLMQQLTAAYRANDMHTLLRLELEWLQHGEQDAGRLSDEKLAIYNEILREQAAALQEEQVMLSNDPRYNPLRRYATGLFGSLSAFNGPNEEMKLKKMLQFLHTLDTTATGLPAIKKLKAVLRDFATEMAGYAREQAIDDMMEDMMDEMMSPPRSGRPRGW